MNGFKVHECLHPGREAFGNYDWQPAIQPPWKPYGNFVNIDACMIEEIAFLWRYGIKTIECCCGHLVTKSYIAVEKEFINKMHELGYVTYGYVDGIERAEIFEARFKT